ncbi:MAG: SOS response-associated peptidase [Acidobacteriota bacterium]
MCGRFSFASPPEVVAEVFGLDEVPALEPRHNVAPTQPVAAVRREDGRRRLVFLRWGLIPAWAKDPAMGNRLINARAETVMERPAFRSAFRARRCLVLADGFYEWARHGGAKQPYFITFKDRRPFALAGLWERWAGTGQSVESCAILTTAPNEVVAPLHDRMPVILPPPAFDLWLDPAVGQPERLRQLLRPHPAAGMVAWPVSPRVNSPRVDDPSCREPLTPSR